MQKGFSIHGVSWLQIVRRAAAVNRVKYIWLPSIDAPATSRMTGLATATLRAVSLLRNLCHFCVTCVTFG